MTRICIIGNSHSGAVKLAAESVLPEFPAAQVDFFAMQGGVFSKLRRDGDTFLPTFPNPNYRRIFQQVNGVLQIDIADYDHIWAIGYRFSLGKLQRVLLKNDVLEWPTRRQLPLISEAFYQTALQSEVTAEVARISKLFGNDPRLVITPAPQPSEKVTRPGPTFDQKLTRTIKMGRADYLQDHHSAAITTQLTAAGYGVMLQPKFTLATPITTQEKYNLGARAFNNPDKCVSDDRHMNAEYGTILLRHYLENFVGMGHTNS